MRMNRLLTVVTTIALFGGLAAATSAATTSTAAAATRVPTIAQWTYSCDNTGTKFSITQENINIRNTPDGSILHSISKNATFDSLSYPAGYLGHTCYSSVVNGTEWVFGEGRASGVIGWVGLNWMQVAGTGSGY
jgi:hypothetical protein